MSRKCQDKTISPFDILCQIGWFVFSQTGSRMEWALRHTPEHHWASKTHWNICINPKIFPHIPNSFTRLHQAQTDANRHWQTTGDSFLHVRLTQSGAKPPFWQNLERQDVFHLTLLRHQNIKISQCTISKNDWVFPSFVNLTPVTKKLQLTVFLDHPVLSILLILTIMHILIFGLKKFGSN